MQKIFCTNNYAKMYDEFQMSGGLITKIMDEGGGIRGYLTRVELPQSTPEHKFVAISYTDRFRDTSTHISNMNMTELKMIAMKKVTVAGERRLKRLLKTKKKNEIKSESIDIISSSLCATIFYDDYFSFRYVVNAIDYFKAFENKIYKYYKNVPKEKITVIVV